MWQDEAEKQKLEEEQLDADVMPPKKFLGQSNHNGVKSQAVQASLQDLAILLPMTWHNLQVNQ